MKRSFLIGGAACLAGFILLLGAAGRSAGDAVKNPFGLRTVSVFETATPPEIPGNTSSPGELAARPRAHPEAPPAIPHGIDDFLPITRDDNMCLGCHLVEEKVEGEATPIPASHFTDLRNAPDTRQEDVVGARYVCVSCHVPQTGAAPLVGNDF